MSFIVYNYKIIASIRFEISCMTLNNKKAMQVIQKPKNTSASIKE